MIYAVVIGKKASTNKTVYDCSYNNILHHLLAHTHRQLTINLCSLS